jgi:hypothetical protein
MPSKPVTEAQCLRRVDEIKTSVKELDHKLDKLMTNDLPHIQTDLALIKAKLFNGGFSINKKTMAILTTLVGVISTLASVIASSLAP